MTTDLQFKRETGRGEWRERENGRIENGGKRGGGGRDNIIHTGALTQNKIDSKGDT